MTKRQSVLANIDWPVFLIVIALLLIGLFNIFSAEYTEQNGVMINLKMSHGKQIINIAIAAALALFILLLDYRLFHTIAYFIYASTLGLLLVTLVVGKVVAGAKGWLSFGGFMFQTAEFAKFGTAIALARYLSTHGIDLRNTRQRLLAMGFIMLPCLLVLAQNDTGSALVFFSLFLVLNREGLSILYILLPIWFAALSIGVLLYDPMLATEAVIIAAIIFLLVYFWRTSRSLVIIVAYSLFSIALAFLVTYLANHVIKSPKFQANLSLIKLGITAQALLFLAIYFYFRRQSRLVLAMLGVVLISVTIIQGVDYFVNRVLKNYQRERIEVLIGKKVDPRGVGYNVNQSLIAIGSGGVFGKGYLQGTQTKFRFVPEQTTDFIFCTVGEEWGLMGSATVVILYIMLMLRIVVIAERQKFLFNRAYAYGLLGILFFHFFINIGMTLKLFPVIGIPLPLVSYGGSSVLAFTIMIFILLKLDAANKVY